jgi:hypothetical protein
MPDVAKLQIAVSRDAKTLTPCSVILHKMQTIQFWTPSRSDVVRSTEHSVD